MLNNDQLLEEEVAKLTSQINMNKEDPSVYDLCRRGAILRRVSDIWLNFTQLNLSLLLNLKYLWYGF